jgi:predicted GNAT family acetyltransferase
METLNPAQVNAERALAEKIGEIWRRRTGTEPEVERRTRLYRLGQLVPPDPAPSGRARVAVADDRELLFDWHHQFHREVGEEIGDRTTIIDDRISYGGLSLWEVDAVPVAMAGRTRVSAGMIRLGPVFTPVELRSRGYGAAVTAAVSATAQQLADEVLLFTDLTNPISNAIYQRLGYQPVHDRWVVHCG